MSYCWPKFRIFGLSSPVTIGTIFAIDKEFFEDIGAFDEGMQLWGGENIDLPIRVSTPSWSVWIWRVTANVDDKNVLKVILQKEHIIIVSV